MCKKSIYLAILFVLMFYFVDNTIAYDDKITHRDITGKATEDSELDQYLKNNLDFKDGIATRFSFNNELKTITKWLEKGAIYEDDPMCRASNHFHDPLKLWNQSFMSDDTTTKQESELRGQESGEQIGCGQMHISHMIARFECVEMI